MITIILHGHLVLVAQSLRASEGLATYLERSQALTILWTPRWASRLWCAYELATFLHDAGQKKESKLLRKRIDLVPLQLPVLLFLLCFSLLIPRLCTLVAEGILSRGSSQQNMTTATSVIAVGSMLVTWPFGLYICLSLMKGMEELPAHLTGFRVQQALCSCCSVGHRHPVTGDAIPCDRELVYRKLSKLYAVPGEGDTSHLDHFNGLVRQDVAAAVLHQVGGSAVPFRYAMRAVGAISIPLLSDYIPLWMGAESGIILVRVVSDWLYHVLYLGPGSKEVTGKVFKSLQLK